MSFTSSMFAVDSPGDEGNMVPIKQERTGVPAGETDTPYGVAGESRGYTQPSDSQKSSPALRQTPHIPSSPARKDSLLQFGPDGNLDEMASTTRGSSRAADLPPPPSSRPAGPRGKKKGTANPIKAPKRGGRGGGVGRRGGKVSAPKRKTTTTDGGGSVSGSVAAGDEEDEGDADDDDDLEGDGGDEDDESDSGPYCICRGPDNHRFMIACERCEDWFHGECIGMDKYTGENLVQQYICPSCADGDQCVTRYKKTCAYPGCQRVARLYGDAAARGEASKFCSDEHTQAWWEHLVATLPKKKQGGADVLTQAQFMGLLGNSPANGKSENDDGWKLGDEPFGIPANFWETTPAKDVFTDEESALLANSQAERHKLGEEIVLSRRMLELVDLAVKNRESLVQSAAYPAVTKDFCGYDDRLDTVGAPASFAAFIAPGRPGEAVVRSGRLELPPAPSPDAAAADKSAAVEALAAVMCVKKKCKPHTGWAGILTKMVKHQIKELAAQAKEMLDYEARIRDCAAIRYRRKQRENHSVEVLDGGGGGDDDKDVDMEDAA